jgi:hypothetical protein
VKKTRKEKRRKLFEQRNFSSVIETTIKGNEEEIQKQKQSAEWPKDNK